LARCAPRAFWERFCAQVEMRITETNLVAGERLWKTTIWEPSLALSIEHVHRPSERLDCVFDPGESVLSFSPSAEIDPDTFSFRWMGGSADILRRGAEEFTLSQALALLLDQLVWPDEP
jgi:hypothetical protein